MGEPKVYRIPIVSLDDPKYSHLARLITFPPSDREQGGRFLPAHAGFNVGSGSDVDISFLYGFRSEPSSGFDRHLWTEEVFVPLQGDFRIPLAACKDPNDPDEKPNPEGFVGAIVCQGEALILCANIWHNGGWPIDPEKGVRYLMFLSGHRAGEGHQGRVDYITQRLGEGVAIVPDWSSAK